MIIAKKNTFGFSPMFAAMIDLLLIMKKLAYEALLPFYCQNTLVPLLLKTSNWYGIIYFRF
jgi:hypothetical protein